jgi:hypothetical protein
VGREEVGDQLTLLLLELFEPGANGLEAVVWRGQPAWLESDDPPDRAL